MITHPRYSDVTAGPDQGRHCLNFLGTREAPIDGVARLLDLAMETGGVEGFEHVGVVHF